MRRSCNPKASKRRPWIIGLVWNQRARCCLLHQVIRFSAGNQLCGVALNKSGIDVARNKISMAGRAGKEARIGSHRPDLDLATGPGKLCCRLGSVTA